MRRNRQALAGSPECSCPRHFRPKRPGAVPEPHRDDAALSQTAAPSLRAVVSKLDQLVAQTYASVRGVNR